MAIVRACAPSSLRHRRGKQIECSLQNPCSNVCNGPQTCRVIVMVVLLADECLRCLQRVKVAVNHSQWVWQCTCSPEAGSAKSITDSCRTIDNRCSCSSYCCHCELHWFISGSECGSRYMCMKSGGPLTIKSTRFTHSGSLSLSLNLLP